MYRVEILTKLQMQHVLELHLIIVTLSHIAAILGMSGPMDYLVTSH